MQRDVLTCKRLEAKNGVAGVKNTRRHGKQGLGMMGEKGQQDPLTRICGAQEAFGF